jgi:hypothetical protein
MPAERKQEYVLMWEARKRSQEQQLKQQRRQPEQPQCVSTISNEGPQQPPIFDERWPVAARLVEEMAADLLGGKKDGGLIVAGRKALAGAAGGARGMGMGGRNVGCLRWLSSSSL